MGLVVLFLCLPISASAEVMDKEPALLWIWGLAIVAGTAGFWLASRRSKWGLATLVLPLIFYAAVFNEIHDPFVGPAIRNEAGSIYIFSAYAVPLFLLFDHVAGWALSQRRRD